MFERYNESARRVLFFARYEASELGSPSIETEHLLLGLFREGKGLIQGIFARFQLAHDDIQKAIDRRTARRQKIPTTIEIPFSPELKRVLHFAVEEADSLTHSYIGGEHLLLGILRDEESVGASVLIEKGLNIRTVREEVVRLLEGMQAGNDSELKLKLSGYTGPGRELFRNVLFEQLYASLPRDPQVKVQIYNAEIAPGGYTNWHCHNGATFFVALQGIFEAEFEEGILIKAKAGDVYSEPIGKFHRGHNPHSDLPYLCIAFCLTAPDLEHVTNVPERPW